MKKTLLFLAALLLSGAAAAQSGYPAKAITTVVGFAPGGGTDTVARIIGRTLGEQLGQQVLTDNKAGAGGNIATDHVVKAAPDGYTIYLANVGALAVNPHLLQLQYDPLKDPRSPPDRTSRRARLRRSPPPAQDATRSCPTCRPWPSWATPATTPPTGTPTWRRPRRRRTSSSG